jgi:5-oxoprolinase (ATP-hydrolysing)
VSANWEFWIDRGGTFTDVIGAAPDGRLVVRKVPSAPAAPDDDDPGLDAARTILAAAGAAPDAVGAVKVGTTVVTNALLEGRGSRVAWVTTRGFGDALWIGQQDRPDLFALHVQRPAPLYRHVVEVDERIDADGSVLESPDPARVRAALRAARAAGCDAVAIAFLHGWCHPAHERAVAALAREIDFAQVSVSHELAPLPRLVPRGDTTVFDARLGSTLRAYVGRLAAQLAAFAPRASLHFMQSSGGLTAPDGFRPAASVLSGPAGGLAGMARLGTALGEPRLIGFDMGGTSTDVSLYDGGFARRFEHRIAGARLAVPMLDVHTIAAGGGSILALRDGRCVVGPESAGARPGPACYGRGGPATLTDVQVVLGRLSPATMPRVFGPRDDAGIDVVAARRALATLAAGVSDGIDAAAGVAAIDAAAIDADAMVRLAAGFLDVAVAAMAAAIRHVAISQGVDPGGFTLFAFGGAAGQHACRVAEASGLGRVIVHPLASVLSAWGIGTADWVETRRRGVQRPLDAAGFAAAAELLGALRAEALSALPVAPPGRGTADSIAVHELRDGQGEATLDVQGDSPAALRQGFRALHRARFGYDADASRIEIAAVRVEARWRAAAAGDAGPPDEPAAAEPRGDGAPRASRPASTRAWFDGWREVPVVAPGSLQGPLDGPALLVEPHSTFVVEPGWRVERLAGGALRAVRAGATAARTRPAARAGDPARLEVYHGLFTHVATQMGEVLRRTAQSVNIKERLDFSCALFDADGRLVANAPHIPVHLGSMGATVRALLATRRGRMRPGDAWMVNSPWHGGTHLPDVTLVSPVFAAGAGDTGPTFFVASRAHHADIGGITPGSMPPFSRTVDEEGVLFEDFELVAAGTLREAELRQVLAGARWPARNPDQNVADLRAQLAANARGAAELQRACAEWGVATLREAMQAVQANAAQAVESAIAALGPRRGRASLALDAGPRIVVEVALDPLARRARIDFAGTSPAGPHNFQAPRAVVTAAVLYVFRTLVERPIPLNEGCLAPLEIVVPAGSLLDPPPGSAVVAGNVETSQVVVDALYAALGVLAGSQGTMNNLTFGDAGLQYYETIAGGAGAGRGFEGGDAVQTHMTNSRLTDPEILEQRFPVRVREFAVRRGSGGRGRWRGGDGARRRIEFRAPLEGAILANRRATRAAGLDGGGAGAPGVTTLVRADGQIETLPACAAFRVGAGDAIEILTPGGGACGRADECA